MAQSILDRNDENAFEALRSESSKPHGRKKVAHPWPGSHSSQKRPGQITSASSAHSSAFLGPRAPSPASSNMTQLPVKLDSMIAGEGARGPRRALG